MNSNKTQEKYSEIFLEMKEEKMSWDFEDFLKQTEEKSHNTNTIPLQKNRSSQKWYWLAACLVACFGLIMFFNSFDEETSTIKPVIAENINKSKPKNPNNITKVEENLPLVRKIDTDIYPEKKKSKYKNKVQYLAVHSPKSTPKHRKSAPIEVEKVEYNPNFVVINGKPVATEEEAIVYTKAALEMFGGNINTALENAKPVKLLTVNF